MKNRINFVLGARKILSVNALYGAKMTWVNGRQVATIYKTGEAKQTEAYIKEQIEISVNPINFIKSFWKTSINFQNQSI